MQSRLLTTREQWLLLGVGLAITLGIVTVLWRSNAGADIPEDTFPLGDEQEASLPDPAQPAAALPPAEPTPKPAARIGVGITGAVQAPGLYYFDEGARVQDLLETAGGALPKGDLSDINRTAKLLDETTLLIPRLATYGTVTVSEPANPNNPAPYTRSSWYQFDPYAPPEPAAAPDEPRAHFRASDPAAAQSAGKVNINTASREALESLPGVGPATSGKIVTYRRDQPFRTIGDLEKVSGIGPAKMATLQGLITVE